MPNLKKQNLQCPFCPATSSRGTGLSAHVRARHPKQYKNWNRNSNRFAEASGALAAPKPVSHPEPQEQPVLASPTAVSHQTNETTGNEALNLLQKVHDQLVARKHAIESEIARVEVLKSEHQSVVTQLAAIVQAMGVFGTA